MSNPELRTLARVSRAPSRLVKDGDAAPMPGIAAAAQTPTSSPLTTADLAADGAAPGGSTPPTRRQCPPELTMAKIQELSHNGRLERTASLLVESLTVRAPVPPDTVFVVDAVINGYKLNFKLTSACLVKAAQCKCPDNSIRNVLCKHILRALLTPPSSLLLHFRRPRWTA